MAVWIKKKEGKRERNKERKVSFKEKREKILMIKNKNDQIMDLLHNKTTSCLFRRGIQRYVSSQ